MSAIPPGIVGSILQSGDAQRAAARTADAAKSGDAEAARRLNAGPDAFIDIEATDTDTNVHTDSGGLGSQGRQDSPPEDQSEVDEADVVAADAGDHIDLSA
jgi:hypothetical protein